METYPSTVDQPYSGSAEEFAALCQELEGKEALGMTHSGVESLIDVKGRSLLRRVYEDHLALRASREVKAPVVGRDGVERTHHRHQTRSMDTLFGTVTFTRLAHGARGKKSLRPLDAALNLPTKGYSHGVRRRVALEAPRDSFASTVACVATTTGARVPQRQAEEIVREVSVDFEAFYAARSTPPVASTTPAALLPLVLPADLDLLAPPPPQDEGPPGILALSVDGKGIVMRKQDLLPATRKKAEKCTHKMAKRLSPGEKRNAKRMATVAAVYEIAPFVRTPVEVVGTLHSVATDPTPPSTRKRPRPAHKRVWASVAKPVAQVIAEVFEEAQRRDPHQQRRWVGLVDGNETQIRLLTAQATALGVALVIILDLIHVLEYLWKAVSAFHAQGSKEAETWVSVRLLAILKGDSSSVAAGMRGSATKRGLTKKVRAPVDKCANYLLKYQEFLRYDEYLAQGFPIASGVIEGACRHLIKDRMDVTGARWSLAGAEAVLKLRALRSSGDFDDYWRFHEEQEFLRNHASLYPDPIPFPQRSTPTKDGRQNDHTPLAA